MLDLGEPLLDRRRLDELPVLAMSRRLIDELEADPATAVVAGDRLNLRVIFERTGGFRQPPARTVPSASAVAAASKRLLMRRRRQSE